MHEFMTQRMVALIAFTYAQWDLSAGDPFLATPDDRPYLKRTGKARDDDATPAVPQARAVLQPAAAPAAPIAAPPSEPIAVEADGRIINEFEEAPAAADGATGRSEQAAAPTDTPAAPTSRRRGRPSNAERAAAAAGSPAEK